MPGQTHTAANNRASANFLQWRAGQLPGQTMTWGGPDGPVLPFNGGPGNCPAKRGWRERNLTNGSRPSMEGRAIARPNCAATAPVGRWGSSFNGGPGNCPAKHQHYTRRTGRSIPSMEGRAIARPNSSRSPPKCHRCTRSFNGGPGNCPAKPHDTAVSRFGPLTFNGGPGNCPAKLDKALLSELHAQALQWRAGQLPGQTWRYGRAAT